jgi:hypothetical protein
MNKLFEIDLLAILRLVPCAIKTLKNYLAKARERKPLEIRKKISSYKPGF